ncbi:unnamed protein product [Cylindrotheca closterium]|uniref:Uncharacterized protein n=1 Tax=Cylindrotheca closterium TaxID=2856 RepID=A0AAD2FHV5_9STRA|nr:unnamed protein product [Cylindrotheca closterium]
MRLNEGRTAYWHECHALDTEIVLYITSYSCCCGYISSSVDFATESPLDLVNAAFLALDASFLAFPLLDEVTSEDRLEEVTSEVPFEVSLVLPDGAAGDGHWGRLDGSLGNFLRGSVGGCLSRCFGYHLLGQRFGGCLARRASFSERGSWSSRRKAFRSSCAMDFLTRRALASMGRY